MIFNQNLGRKFKFFEILAGKLAICPSWHEWYNLCQIFKSPLLGTRFQFFFTFWGGFGIQNTPKTRKWPKNTKELDSSFSRQKFKFEFFAPKNPNFGTILGF